MRDWRKAESFPQSYWKWAKRARQAAPMIEEKWVCDLGCGQQPLKWFLPRDAVYLPADLQRWTPDTELCDLDAGNFPERSLAAAETVAMLGVLAHLRNPETALAELSRRSEFFVISLNSRERDGERYWSPQDFVGMLEQHGFQIIGEREYVYEQKRMLFRARNSAFTSEMRERREAAQSAYSNSLAKPPSMLGRTYHRIRTLRHA